MRRSPLKQAFKNANVTSSLARVKLKKMLASISLIRVSTTGFRGKKYWRPQSTFLNAQEARAAALGGCLAQLRRPCWAVFAVLLHSHVTFRVAGFSAGCAGTEDNPQPRCTQSTADQRPHMN